MRNTEFQKQDEAGAHMYVLMHGPCSGLDTIITQFDKGRPLVMFTLAVEERPDTDDAGELSGMCSELRDAENLKLAPQGAPAEHYFGKTLVSSLALAHIKKHRCIRVNNTHEVARLRARVIRAASFKDCAGLVLTNRKDCVSIELNRPTPDNSRVLN